MADNCTMTKYTEEYLKAKSIYDLRKILRGLGGVPGGKGKADLIAAVLSIQENAVVPNRSARGRKPLEMKEYAENFEKKILSEKEEPVNGGFPGLLPGGNPEELSETKQSNGEKRGAQRPDGLSVANFSDSEPKDEGAPTDVKAEGVLELHPDGYGFLRAANYECTTKDVFVARPLVKQYGLRRGDFIVGTSAKLRETGAAALRTVYSVNGYFPEKLFRRPNFDDLTARYPCERFTLEKKDSEFDLSIRSMDLFCPIGKGQRGLIVAPPKAGKTTLLKKIANSIGDNYPSAHLITLLIDERPEEVTDMRESVKGEVVYSTFDETAEHHIKVSELVMWRAKRLAELGKDVVILLDSLTKLARAYNSTVPSSGKILSGGIDPIALQPPKKFFGSARNIDNGGSLTIIATVLVETGSRMDDVIYEEFKGTGNMELMLSRQLSERRIFPAIDLYKSGTRKDELLLMKAELDCAYSLRRLLAEDRNASENVLDMMAKCRDNAEFVKRVPEWIKLARKSKEYPNG